MKQGRTRFLRHLLRARFVVLALLSPPATAFVATAPLRSSALRAQVVATGTNAPPKEQTAQLGEIFRQTREVQRSGGEPSPEAVAEEVAALEQFVAENPASAYTPSLRVNLARHHRSAA